MSTFGPALHRHGFALGKARRRRLATAAMIGVAVSLAALQDAVALYVASCGSSKAQIVRITVANYAHEAFPQWAAAHPGRSCPAELAELHAWMDFRGTRDVYGEPYRWSCTVTSRGATLVVRSAGEDAVDGTADDVSSDQVPHTPRLPWSTR